MEITLSLQAVFTGVVTLGGSVIIFFLQRIYTQFEKVVEKLNETSAKVMVLESRVAALEHREREREAA